MIINKAYLNSKVKVTILKEEYQELQQRCSQWLLQIRFLSMIKMWSMMHQKTAKWRTMRTTAIVWIPTKHKPETTFRRQKWLNMIVVLETESIHLVPTHWRKKRQVITENIDLSLQSSQNLLYLHSTNFSKFHPPILLAEWKISILWLSLLEDT